MYKLYGLSFFFMKKIVQNGRNEWFWPLFHEIHEKIVRNGRNERFRPLFHEFS